MEGDRTILRETGYIACMVIVMSLVMQAFFLVIGRWDYTVLLGNLLGVAAAISNFYLLGLMVQKAVLDEPDHAKGRIRSSQMLRLMMQVVLAVIGAVAPCFNIFAVLLPLLFPRIAIGLQGLLANYR